MKINITSVLALALLLCIPVGAQAGHPEAQGFEHTGYTHDPRLQELSGLVASRRHPGVYWAHNDSGHESELFAIRPDGEVVARVRVSGAGAFDWEDIAAWVDDQGRSWLLIGDVGDNFSLRSEVKLYVVPEPTLDQMEVRVARSITLRYADGPRDAESLAVDWPHRQILLLDKGRQPATLYAAPLMQDAVRAEPVARLPILVPDAPALVQPLAKAWRGTATSMDLTADGRHLAILTYRHLYVFERREAERWQETVRRQEHWRELPRLGGFEALAWDADGRELLICNEGEWVHYYRSTGLFRTTPDTPAPVGSSDGVSTPPAPARTPKEPVP